VSVPIGGHSPGSTAIENVDLAATVRQALKLLEEMRKKRNIAVECKIAGEINIRACSWQRGSWTITAGASKFIQKREVEPRSSSFSKKCPIWSDRTP
jgi:hypothetical protein